MEEKIKELIEKLASLEELSQSEIDLLTKLNAKAASQTEEKPDPIRRLVFEDGNSKIRSISEIENLPARLLSDEEKELQGFADEAYILSTVLKTDPRGLKYWDKFQTKSTALRKALDTATAGEGTEWVPTKLSAELIENFRLASRVAGLFMDVPMPSNPYEPPFISGSPTFYYVPESKSDDATASPPTNVTTGKQTLSAKKLKARIYFSDELTEDSIVPVLPVLKEELIAAGAEALDDTILNGDTTTPHQDADVENSKDHRKAWKGLRKLCPAGTKVDLGTFNYTNVKSIRKKMGIYGIDPKTLACITGPVGYDALSGLSEVTSVEKYGPKAVVLTGELGKLLGSPVLVSAKIREDLNASGVYDGTTMDNSILILVNRRGFMLGTRGLPRLTFKDDAEVDQAQLITRFRKAFTNRWTVSATVKTIGLGFNITV